MDGNRRYARKNQLQSLYQGHIFGYEQLERILQWSKELGIRYISVYAFSIENFKRPPQEVDFLMELALEKFKLWSQDMSIVHKYRIRVIFHGNFDLLREDVRHAVETIMSETRDHGEYQLHVLMPYTSRDELCSFLSVPLDGMSAVESLDYRIGSQSEKAPHCDLLVRTSGEYRLSDCFLWQVTRHSCHVQFLTVLWPELSIWDFFCVLMRYKLHRMRVPFK
jgi:ditrans,polycis-polyprenyl diphosphate synthase